jgi:hypothetical protein
MTDILQRIKSPAIGLLVVGVLNGAIGLMSLASGILRLAGVMKETIPVNEAERMGYYIGTFGSYLMAFLSLIAAPIIIYGAMQMMKGQKYGLAKIAAILAIIPLTSCCFLAGIPIGIWAFVVLRSPEVKAFFESGMNNQHFPQSPPQF